MKNFLIGLGLIIFINSCSIPLSSPLLDMTNQSDDYIYNIKGTWNGYRFGGWGIEHYKKPGQSGSRSFIIEKKSDIFGSVHVEWENAKREKIFKDFEFTREMLPSFSRKDRGVIYFLFTQNDLEIDVVSEELDGDCLFYTYKTRPELSRYEDLKRPEVQKRLAKLDADQKFIEYFNKREARNEITQQIQLDLSAICPPDYLCKSNKADCPKDCRDVMPIYRSSNIPKINKARKLYEEQEKVRKENMRKYRERKRVIMGD